MAIQHVITANTCSFSYQLDLVNQFATKYSHILSGFLHCILSVRASNYFPNVVQNSVRMCQQWWPFLANRKWPGSKANIPLSFSTNFFLEKRFYSLCSAFIIMSPCFLAGIHVAAAMGKYPHKQLFKRCIKIKILCKTCYCSARGICVLLLIAFFIGPYITHHCMFISYVHVCTYTNCMYMHF